MIWHTTQDRVTEPILTLKTIYKKKRILRYEVLSKIINIEYKILRDYRNPPTPSPPLLTSLLILLPSSFKITGSSSLKLVCEYFLKAPSKLK